MFFFSFLLLLPLFVIITTVYVNVNYSFLMLKENCERLQTRRPCQFLLLGLDKGHFAASHRMDHADINEN